MGRLKRAVAVGLAACGFVLSWSIPAQADPVSGLLAGLGLVPLNLLASSPLYLFGVSIGGAVAAALPSLLFNVAVTAGVAVLNNAFAQKSKALRPNAVEQANPGSRLVNLRQPTQPRTRSYGLVRIGGPVAFWQLADGARYVIVLLMTGRIDLFVAHFLDDREVTLGSGGLVQDAAFQSGGNSMVTIEAFDGAPGQVSPPLINNAFSEWTDDHTLTGIAGAALRFENPIPDDFATVYPSGREPNYSALVRAGRCFDPRNGSTAYTTNAALIIADWIVSPDGLGQDVDWDIVAEEADVAEQTVIDRNGNSFPRWQLCGTYGFNETRESVRSALGIACDAFFFETEVGKVGFRLGREALPNPAFTVTAEHVLSATITEGTDGTSQVNAIEVVYTEPAAGYREHAAPAYHVDDGAPFQAETVAAYFVPNGNQAVRVAKTVMRSIVAQYHVQLKLTLFGLALRTERFFALDLSVYGVSGVFEIEDWRWVDDGLAVQVTAYSVNANALTFDAATEEPAASQITSIESSASVPDPTNVTASSPGAGQLLADWDDPPRISLLSRVRYRVNPSGDWFAVSVPSGQSYQLITGLAADDYDVEVQLRTATGQAGNWVAASTNPVTVS